MAVYARQVQSRQPPGAKYLASLTLWSELVVISATQRGEVRGLEGVVL